MDKILATMDSKDDQLVLRAALAWVAEDVKLRELIMKEIKHKKDMQLLDKQIAGEDRPKEEEEEESTSAPVISLKALS